ncbi:MAG: glycosyltransferase family 4 protein [Acidimicrobiia bacterium]
MLILQVCADQGIAPGGTKGASVHLRHVAGALGNRGHRVVTVAKREPVYVNPHPAPVRSLDRGLLAAVREFGLPNLVYERYSLGHTAALEFAHGHDLPFVLEVNSPLTVEALTQRHAPVGFAEHAAEDRLFREADSVVVVSRPLADYVERLRGRSDGIVVVPNGVDPAAFPITAAHTGGSTLAFLGHPKPWHGVSRLADVVAAVAIRHSAVSIVVIGGGLGVGELMHRARATGVDDRITVTGPLGENGVATILFDSAVGVAPYPPNDFFYFSPLKVVEYMMAGLPVVASAVGDVAATVGDGGFVVDPADDDALASAVSLLLHDPNLRRRLGGIGRRRALAEFTWDRVASQIEQAASALVGGSR